MSTLAIVLVLMSAFLHVTWNYATKRIKATSTFLVCWMTVTAAVMAPVAVCLGIEIVPTLSLQAWVLIAISAPIHLVYATVLQTGYRKSDFSVVYPVARGTGPLLTVVAAVAAFGDRPGLWGSLGIAALIIGIALIAVPQKVAVDRAKVRAGLFWGLLCGLCISLYSVVDAWSVQKLAIAPLFYYACSATIRALWLLAIACLNPQFKREAPELIHSHWRTILLVAAASPGAYLTILYTLTFTPLSFVAPCREIAMMLGVFAAALLLREKVSKTRTAGILAMGSGIVLLALAG